MKVLKLSWMGLLALVCVVFFYACKKDVYGTSLNDTPSAISSSATARTANEANFPTSLSWVGSCSNDEGFTINANSIPGVSSIVVSLGNTEIKNEPSNSLSVNVGTSTNPRTYTVYFELGRPGGGASKKTLSITIPGCDGGVTPPDVCEPGLFASGINGLDYVDNTTCSGNSEGQYTAVYTIKLCGNESFPLKLQGGLTNGANFINSNVGMVAKTSNGVGGKNTSLNRTFNSINDLLPLSIGGGLYQVKVTFTKSKSTLPGDWATGAWSLKNADGVPLGYKPAVYDGETLVQLEVSGYTERLAFGSLTCN